jgi:hypothetical protein
MGKFDNVTGNVYGRLTVLKYVGKDNQKCTKWECLCECGKIISTRASALKNGTTKSCGCYRTDTVKYYHYTTGESTTRIHREWNGMKNRATNKSAKNADAYVNRGITICEEWKDYYNFKKWALKNGYSDELQIDRIDNDKGYYPENCRWVDSKTNSRVGGRRSLRNKTGCIGVIKNKYGTYNSQITINTKLIKHGSFKALEDAIETRLKSEIEHFGSIQQKGFKNYKFKEEK